MSVEITELVSRLVIFLVVLLLSISIHEAGHAWMSWKWGDDTAYLLGRVTLNPIAHTDPIGTLVLPMLGFISVAAGGIPLLGWGKPCPVNPSKWTNYKLANFWVSIAGVLGNAILLIAGIVIAKTLIAFQVIDPHSINFKTDNPISMFLQTLIYMNLSLFVFNLLPFPPLDGSKILANFLPASFQPIFSALDQYGTLVLFALVAMGITSKLMAPVFGLVDFIF
jgi:Zn-dependent protease